MRALALLTLVACSSGELAIFGRIPAEIDRTAILGYASDGRFLGATKIEPYAPGQAMRTELGADPGELDRMVVVGYSSDRLTSKGFDLALWPDVAVKVATPEDAPLPAGHWAAEGRRVSEQVELESLVTPPVLALPGFGVCPNLVPDAPLAVDVYCAPLPCNSRINQRACDIFVDLGECAAFRLQGKVDANGRVSGTDCIGLDPRDALFSFSCLDCRVDVHQVESDSPPFRISKHKVIDVPVQTLDRDVIIDGPAQSMVVLPDRVVVSTFDGVLERRLCGARYTTRFVSLDLDTLQEIGTTTVGGCVSRIAPDPLGDGFFGVDDDSGRRLRRFNREGLELDRIHLKNDPGWDGTHVATQMNPPRVAVAVRRNGDPAASRVDIFDARTMERTGSVEYEHRLASLFWAAGDILVVGVDGALRYIGPDGSLRETLVLGTGTGISNEPQLLYQRADFFIASNYSGSAPGVHILRSGQIEAAAYFFMRPGGVTALADWTADRAAVVVHDTIDNSAHLGFLGLPIRRFLPEVYPIGHGPGTHAAYDAQGRLWILFPWSAEVARLEPL